MTSLPGVYLPRLDDVVTVGPSPLPRHARLDGAAWWADLPMQAPPDRIAAWLHRLASGADPITTHHEPWTSDTPDAKETPMSSPDGSFPPPVRAGILDVRQGRCAGCDRPATEAHHRDPRGMGGTSRVDVGAACNGLPLCAAHHRAAESHRREAAILGWLTIRPDAVPFWTLDGWRAWIMLTDGGVSTWCVRTVDDDEIPAAIRGGLSVAWAVLGVAAERKGGAA